MVIAPGMPISHPIAVLPEALLTLGGLLLLVLPRFRAPRLLGLYSLCVLVGALDLKLATLIQAPFHQTFFSEMLVLDRFTLFFQILSLGTLALVGLSLIGYARPPLAHHREMHALLLFSGVALSLTAGAQNLALIYVGIEMISLLSYLLVGFLKKEALSAEAALKYFLFGSLATGVMLYGISLMYGLTGTLDLAQLGPAFAQAALRAPWLCTATLLLLLAGIGFKIALAPFHMWAPDAYEGAPTPVTSFLSVAPKLAGFAVLARLFLVALGAQAPMWAPALAALCVVTMTVGNVVALLQDNVKRMLAYSSIAHAGTIAIGMAVATPLGLTAALYYLLAYLLMNVAAFAAVIAVGNATGREDVSAFAGLSRREPWLAALTALALLSLAGIPPTAGFFAKMWIFGSAVKAGAIWLAVAAALNGVVAFFYYARVIKAMYLDPAPPGAPAIRPSRALQLTLALCGLATLAIGLMPGPWLVISADALPLSFKTPDFPWI